MRKRTSRARRSKDERCNECGERVAAGLGHEDPCDGRFYCNECWKAYNDNTQEAEQRGLQPRLQGQVPDSPANLSLRRTYCLLQEEIASKKMACETAERLVVEAQEKLQPLEKVLASYDARLKEFESLLPAHIQKIEEYNARVDLAEGVVRECCDQVAQLRLASATADLRDAKTDLDRAEKDLDRAYRKLEFAKTDLDRAYRKLEFAKTDLREAKTDLDRAKTDLDRAKTDLRFANSKLEFAKNDLRVADTAFFSWIAELAGVPTSTVRSSSTDATWKNIDTSRCCVCGKLKEGPQGVTKAHIFADVVAWEFCMGRHLIALCGTKGKAHTCHNAFDTSQMVFVSLDEIGSVASSANVPDTTRWLVKTVGDYNPFAPEKFGIVKFGAVSRHLMHLRTMHTLRHALWRGSATRDLENQILSVSNIGGRSIDEWMKACQTPEITLNKEVGAIG